jgi:hypothetical protein
MDKLIDDYHKYSGAISRAESIRQILERGINEYLRERSIGLKRNTNFEITPDDVPTGMVRRTNSLGDRDPKTIKFH